MAEHDRSRERHEFVGDGSDCSVCREGFKYYLHIPGECVIGKRPNDGRGWDGQCARCGSSMSFEPCEMCDHEDWEACRCDFCDGTCAFEFCLSSAEWCHENPLNGRHDVPRATVEWFTFDEAERRSADA